MVIKAIKIANATSTFLFKDIFHPHPCSRSVFSAWLSRSKVTNLRKVTPNPPTRSIHISTAEECKEYKRRGKVYLMMKNANSLRRGSKWRLHPLIHTFASEISAHDVEKKKAEPRTPHFLSVNQDIVDRSQKEKWGLKYVMFTQH